MSARGTCSGPIRAGDPGGHSVHDPCPDPECHRYDEPAIGPELRRRRELRGMTQADLAEAASRVYKTTARITPQQVSDWERGRPVRGLRVARALAEALHCGVDDLLGGRRV